MYNEVVRSQLGRKKGGREQMCYDQDQARPAENPIKVLETIRIQPDTPNGNAPA